MPWTARPAAASGEDVGDDDPPVGEPWKEAPEPEEVSDVSVVVLEEVRVKVGLLIVVLRDIVVPVPRLMVPWLVMVALPGAL